MKFALWFAFGMLLVALSFKEIHDEGFDQKARNQWSNFEQRRESFEQMQKSKEPQILKTLSDKSASSH